jgi:Na+/H+ antiporter NhaD/arsenite permease-like protein
MILAGYMKLTFFDFFIFDGKLSLFFIVQAGALSGLGTLYFIFRRRYYGRKIEKVREEKIKSKRSVLAFIFAILWLILSSFNKRLFGYAAGTGSLIISLILLLSSKKDSLKVLKRFDYDTVLILMGIFIIINVVNNSGVVQLIANFIETYLKGNVFMIFLTLIFISVFFSAFIDNVPFVTAMIPVGMKIAEGLNINQYLLTFGIIIGATIGGNITPIGASANIVGYGIIKREGEDFTFGQFVKIGFLFTFFATLFSSILLWFIWR